MRLHSMVVEKAVRVSRSDGQIISLDGDSLKAAQWMLREWLGLELDESFHELASSGRSGLADMWASEIAPMLE